MNDGTVHLNGRVPSPAVLQTALHAAETTPGVTAVESEIVVTN
jgi:osmotically-inducible protein OsmY